MADIAEPTDEKKKKKKRKRNKKQKAEKVASSDENESVAKTAADDESVSVSANLESEVEEVDETFEMTLSLFTQKLASFRRMFEPYTAVVKPAMI